MKLRGVSKYSIGLGAVAATAAVFAGGFAAATALDDDDVKAKPAAQVAEGPIRVPNVARETYASAPNSQVASMPGAPQQAGAGYGADKVSAIYPGPGPYYCQGDLPAISTGNGFDLGKAGFTMKTLGAGFTLQNVNIGTEATCDDEGNPTDEQFVVLTTTWRNTETGFQVSVTQREREKATPNVRYPLSADFWNGGYQFQLYVNYGYYPYAKDGVTTGGGVADSPAVAQQAPDKSSLLPVPDDPRAEAVLNAALAQLVPNLGPECFYTQVRGGWEDLGKLGFGDPRPAIPQGYKENSSEVAYFSAPPASCNVATFDNQGNLFASWVNESNGKYTGSISVNAYPMPEGQIPQLGWIDEYNASWTNGKWQFHVSGNGAERGIGVETIRAIAKAMDPGFNDACFLRRVDLKPADLASRNLREPQPPAGYDFSTRNLTAVELPKDCVAIPEAQTNSYSLYWELADGTGNIISASLNRQDGGIDRGEFGGSISDQFINWADGKGSYYSVSGYSNSGGAGPSRDIIVAVAKSLDPSLDTSKLEEIPYAGKPVRPAIP